MLCYRQAWLRTLLNHTSTTVHAGRPFLSATCACSDTDTYSTYIRTYMKPQCKLTLPIMWGCCTQEQYSEYTHHSDLIPGTGQGWWWSCASLQRVTRYVHEYKATRKWETWSTSAKEKLYSKEGLVLASLPWLPSPSPNRSRQCLWAIGVVEVEVNRQNVSATYRPSSAVNTPCFISTLHGLYAPHHFASSLANLPYIHELARYRSSLTVALFTDIQSGCFQV